MKVEDKQEFRLLVVNNALASLYKMDKEEMIGCFLA